VEGCACAGPVEECACAWPVEECACARPVEECACAWPVEECAHGEASAVQGHEEGEHVCACGLLQRCTHAARPPPPGGVGCVFECVP